MAAAEANAISADTPPLVALALVSAGALGYEILLVRLFAIVQWHHFAYMAISLAMLGYGVAGTLLALLRERLLQRYRLIFAGCAMLFGVTAVGAFLLAQWLPFNPLELFWDLRQPFYLLLLYLVLSVPFLFAAGCISLTFVRYGAKAHRIYSFDLLGAAAGSLLILLLLFRLQPEDALLAVGMLGIFAAALAVLKLRLPRRLLLPLLLIAVALLIMPDAWRTLRLSPYKGLSQALLLPGARIVEQRASPLGLLSVVESPRVPFRHVPGLSLNAGAEPPPQLGVFHDGDAMSALTRFNGDPASVAYLGDTTAALPYHLLREPHVLVLGAGSGAEVLRAVALKARRIDAVELNHQLVELVQQRYAEFAGGLYSRPEVRVQVAEARSFIESDRERYDLIQVSLMDAFGAGSAGLHGLSEGYLYTVEGMRAYLRHLRPGGMLALTRWVTLPPRDPLKLAATILQVLAEEGVAEPQRQLALVRGWQTATLLVKNGVFTADEIARIRSFADRRSFDVDWPLDSTPVAPYNVLERPYYSEGIAALSGEARSDFIERYKFDLRPATDDRPYFFHFFRWKSLPEILRLKQQGGLPLLELGYPMLVAALLQAILVSALLILLPLAGLTTCRRAMREAKGKRATAAYFSAIGFGFIFVEMAFIQKFSLFLGHPLYAVAAVLCAFLAFAGLGSRYAPLLLNRLPGGERPLWPVVAIALLVGLYLAASPALLPLGAGLTQPARIVIAILLVAPLAFCMGMPFPLGLARLEVAAPALLPWAWAINACATVVGAVLATLLAVHVGFAMVALGAVGLYAAASAVFGRLGTGAQIAPA